MAADTKGGDGDLTARIQGDGKLRNPNEACKRLTQLRDAKRFDDLIELAEAIGRVAPNEPAPRRLYAQALINTGRVTAAIDVLEAVRVRLLAKGRKKIDAMTAAVEIPEVTGLLGRSYKQIYFDARNRGSAAAQESLRKSISAYAAGYRADRVKNTWHGVNLLALVEHCSRTGLPYPKEHAPKPLAKALLGALAKIRKPDAWNLATIAEATLGTGDWSQISDALVKYTNAPDITAFHIDSTLRQLRDVWRLDDDPRGKPLLEILTAYMMFLPEAPKGAQVELTARQVKHGSIPSAENFEATLGKIKGAETRDWWQTGLDQGKGVAAIWEKLNDRIGTGFLVHSKSIGIETLDEHLVLTNHHVVNENGVGIGLAPDRVEIVFEAVDKDTRYEISEVLCESPPDECDFCLVRLTQSVKDAAPLTIGTRLPALQEDPPQPQVFVIGHPLGKVLKYSFQDNEMIDHEGPTLGTPPKAVSRRVHYRAPTERGNSGSPVFNGQWKVIALHHAGGAAMPKLNGRPGTQPANEGIWMQSIIDMIRRRMP